METYDMFAKAIAEFPEFKWQYRHNNDLMSELMPIKNPNGDTWHTGRMCAAFDVDGNIVTVEVYCFNGNESFASQKACQKAIDEQPF